MNTEINLVPIGNGIFVNDLIPIELENKLTKKIDKFKMIRYLSYNKKVEMIDLNKEIHYMSLINFNKTYFNLLETQHQQI